MQETYSSTAKMMIALAGDRLTAIMNNHINKIDLGIDEASKKINNMSANIGVLDAYVATPDKNNLAIQQHIKDQLGTKKTAYQKISDDLTKFESTAKEVLGRAKSWTTTATKIGKKDSTKSTDEIYLKSITEIKVLKEPLEILLAKTKEASSAIANLEEKIPSTAPVKQKPSAEQPAPKPE